MANESSLETLERIPQQKSNEIDIAVARYKTCGASGYQVPNVYLFAANILREAGRTEDALKELQAARVQFPREQSLIIEELNIYLESQDYERAENNLKLAAEGDPNNEILWFSLGSVYDNLDKTDQAADAYLKAISIKSDYFDANYNLGAMYFAGEGIRKNSAEAYKWFYIAGELGNEDARSNLTLAEKRLPGSHVKKGTKLALKWLKSYGGDSTDMH